jgi:hypothetical protein
VLACMAAWIWMRMMVELSAIITIRLRLVVGCGCCGLEAAVDCHRFGVFIWLMSPFLREGALGIAVRFWSTRGGDPFPLIASQRGGKVKTPGVVNRAIAVYEHFDEEVTISAQFSRMAAALPHPSATAFLDPRLDPVRVGTGGTA